MSPPQPSAVSVQPTLGVSWSGTTWLRIAILTVMLGVLYRVPLDRSIVSWWIHDANWSHGWLIPAFSLYFLYSRRDELMRVVPSTNYLGAAILISSLAMSFVSMWRFQMAYPQAISIVGAIFGLVLWLGGWSVMRIAWFPILYLVLAIPLPQRVFVELTMPLRQIASQFAAAVMPWFAAGLYTESQAVVIDYVMPGMSPGTLNVEEACSGMRSTMAILALGTGITYLDVRPLWHRVVMMGSCVPIAVFFNTIRVTVTGLLFVHGFPQYAKGGWHEALGYVMFAAAVGVFLLLGYVLNHLWIEDSTSGLEGSSGDGCTPGQSSPLV